jgi:hypothetical protein
MKQVKVSTLKPWEQNPRDITEDKFKQLLKQLRYGEVENLIVMKDGTVVSGNRRLDAYKIVGKETAWVAEAEYEKQDNGKYHLIVDGLLAKHVYPKEIKGNPVEFNSPMQIMTELMTLGNAHVGTFNDIGLAELLTHAEIEPNLKSGTRVEDLVAALGPTPLQSIDDEEELPPNRSPIKKIEFYLNEDDFVFAKSIIKKWMKEGGMANQNEVFVEAMIAMDDRLDGINYNG